VADEVRVKAAVIYNLLLFIDWPGDIPTGDFRLCLIEGGALAVALQDFAGKPIHGRRFAPHPIGGGADELQSCFAVMVEAGNPVALARAGATARNRPLLVIGEGTGATDRGAMVSLAAQGSRMVFDVDLGALRRAHLGASSKLLRLARRVVE